MHRHLQFGMRENPASNRRHGSRSLFHDDNHESTQGTTGGEKKTAGQLLTVVQVAELLNVPVSWIYEHTRPHCVRPIPHLKIGKYLRFSRASISQYIDDLQSSNCLDCHASSRYSTRR
ncbi:MAG TPA: helix-turn-helix domain-containing protein [Candidatus Angelobacter sp.]|nr:helix-turn-helix domain-containing protein [Candidatus Angelobacter sp.]